MCFGFAKPKHISAYCLELFGTFSHIMESRPTQSFIVLLVVSNCLLYPPVMCLFLFPGMCVNILRNDIIRLSCLTRKRRELHIIRLIRLTS